MPVIAATRAQAAIALPRLLSVGNRSTPAMLGGLTWRSTISGCARFQRAVALLLFWLLFAGAVQGQAVLLVPYAPNGTFGPVASAVAAEMSTILGLKIQVEHNYADTRLRTIQQFLEGPGDGKKLVFADMNMLLTYKNWNNGNGFMEQGQIVGIVGEERLVLVTAKNNGIKSIAQLRASLAANPGSIGGVGPDTVSGKCAQQLKDQLGFRAETYIPVALTLLESVKNGTLMAACLQARPALARDTTVLASNGPSIHLGSDVPLFGEEKLSMTVTSLNGLFLPQATPKTIVDSYAAALVKSLGQPAVRNALSEAFGTPQGQVAPTAATTVPPTQPQSVISEAKADEAAGRWIALDGATFKASESEIRDFNVALALLRRGEYAATAKALAEFMRRYPGSGYADASLYWLASAQYADRQYRNAIASAQMFVKRASQHPKAPEALLVMASSYSESGDKKLAAQTLSELKKNYPDSSAAQSLTGTGNSNRANATDRGATSGLNTGVVSPSTPVATTPVPATQPQPTKTSIPSGVIEGSRAILYGAGRRTPNGNVIYGTQKGLGCIAINPADAAGDESFSFTCAASSLECAVEGLPQAMTCAGGMGAVHGNERPPHHTTYSESLHRVGLRKTLRAIVFVTGYNECNMAVAMPDGWIATCGLRDADFEGEFRNQTEAKAYAMQAKRWSSR